MGSPVHPIREKKIHRAFFQNAEGPSAPVVFLPCSNAFSGALGGALDHFCPAHQVYQSAIRQTVPRVVGAIVFFLAYRRG